MFTFAELPYDETKNGLKDRARSAVYPPGDVVQVGATAQCSVLARCQGMWSVCLCRARATER
jgi:hypothetical protein